MKKTYAAIFNFYSLGDSLIISFAQKKYKISCVNGYKTERLFFPKRVKIIEGDKFYFTKFGKLYRRCATPRNNNEQTYGFKIVKTKIELPIAGDNLEKHINYFDNLESAQLWLALQKDEFNNTVNHRGYTSYRGGELPF